MRVQLLILASLIGLTVGHGPRLDVCSNPPKATVTLPASLRLPLDFKISGSVTDWSNEQTWLIQETSTKDFRVVERQTNGFKEKWIQDHRDDEQYMFINSSAPTQCNGNASKPELFNQNLFLQFTSIADTSSIKSMIDELVSMGTFHKGFVVDNGDVVGGVNVKTWILCVDSIKKYFVEVKFSEDVNPASPNFHNPILLSFRMAEMDSSTSSKNHWSVELDRYENPIGNEAVIPHGVYCERRNESSLRLKPLNEFSAVLNYRNHQKKTSEAIEVFYSKSNQYLILSGGSFENLINKQYIEGTDYILHDFKYGYEFTMNNGACSDFFSLPEKANDVLLNRRDENGTYFLQNPLEYTIIPMSIVWSQYRESDEFIDLRGVSYLSIGNIWELRLTLDREIHSFRTYDLTTKELVMSMTVNKISKSTLSKSPVFVSSCYDDGTPGNNTWILPIRNKNLVDLKRIGVPLLNAAIQKAITKNVYPVIPYRIVTQYMIDENNKLSLVLRIAEKSVVEPSLVDGYEYSREIETDGLFRMIEEALKTGKMPIDVETIDGPETWIIDGNSIKPYPMPGQVQQSVHMESEDVHFKVAVSFVIAVVIVVLGLGVTWIIVSLLLNRKQGKSQMKQNLLINAEYQKF